MRILVTATAADIDAEADPRFGRGQHFLVVDTETMAWEAHKNPATDASGGAGTQAAQFVATLDPQAVISGDFGPNAYLVLAAAETDMFLMGGAKTVREAVADFVAGRLEQVGAPTGAGHHGGS